MPQLGLDLNVTPKNPSLDELLHSRELETPAFVYSESVLGACLEVAQSTASAACCRLLYSLKACSYFEVAEIIAQEVDGFGCSSPFEAQLARTIGGEQHEVHYTSPAFRELDLPFLKQNCDYISFNSLNQLRRYGSDPQWKGQCGIRINPGLSFVEDSRYDPVRSGSRLGIPIEDLRQSQQATGSELSAVTGIHVHNNCDSADFSPLLETVQCLVSEVPELLQQVAWVNLGGGYLFDEIQDNAPLIEATELLATAFGVNVYVEPGAAIVRKSGCLISTVLDIVRADGEVIAVLDTTVNHWPEVFEYQFEPDLLGHSESGSFEYTLAGCTCLAGDVFGSYSLNAELKVGDRICFTEAGAYSVAKAHYFNGVNLPSLWLQTAAGDLIAGKEFTYEEFRSRWGGSKKHALV